MKHGSITDSSAEQGGTRGFVYTYVFHARFAAKRVVRKWLIFIHRSAVWLKGCSLAEMIHKAGNIVVDCLSVPAQTKSLDSISDNTRPRKLFALPFTCPCGALYDVKWRDTRPSS